MGQYKHNRTCSTRRRAGFSRLGGTAVEFAFVAPLLVSIVSGMAYVGRMYDIHNHFSLAAREGARVGAMDRQGLVQEGETTNEKVIRDVRAYLNANGLPGDDVNVVIATVDDPHVPFDMDDPDNDLEQFQIILEIDYSELNGFNTPGMKDFKFGTRVVFRNARASVFQ